jgi:hypothetical protein
MGWQIPKIWQDGECWIVGGGPSFADQFNIPQSVIKEVCYGNCNISEYAKYLGFLRDKHVIGINNAYMLGDIIDIVFFGDSSWYKLHKKELDKRNHLKVTCSVTLKEKGIKVLGRDEKYGISKHNGMVCWNNNSGAASISLAHHLGCKKIYLLGFDMTTIKDGDRTHWHKPHYSRYDKPPFEKHLVGFPKIAEDAKHLGIEIINVCPNSAIEAFPKVNLKDII